MLIKEKTGVIARRPVKSQNIDTTRAIYNPAFESTNQKKIKTKKTAAKSQ